MKNFQFSIFNFQVKRGFTLIELLVVIGIIATLTALALPNYMGARQRARDAKRKGELHELKQALRLYYNDFETYPADNGSGGIMGCGDGTALCGTSFATTVTTYMKRLPEEFTYDRIGAGGDDFRLSVPLETLSDGDIAPSQSRCSGTWVAADYVVCAD